MKGKRGIFACSGLLLLFLCAWFGFYQTNALPKKSGNVESDTGAENRSTAMPVEVEAVAGCYGKGENRKAVEQTKIEPKVTVYRNAARGLVLSQEDYEILLRIVEAEATGGSAKSKRMVANVVLNRVLDPHFPDTVSGVVYQRCSDGTAQFSPITDGRFFSVTISKSTKKAVKRVLRGKDETNGALFFVNRASASSRSLAWFDSKLDYLFECGGHSFYCYKDS